MTTSPGADVHSPVGTGRFRTFTQFTPPFWFVNLAELFERAAYYGLMTIFPLYVARVHGFTTPEAVGLVAILQPLLYFVPLVGGTVAEKYGYKQVLLASLACIAIGYLALGAAAARAALVGAIVVVGVGAGLFKPVVAAAVAHATTAEQRNFGFIVYYWFINLGGFIGPLLVLFLVPPDAWGLLFPAAAAFAGGAFATTLLFYRNPVSPQREKDVWEAVRPLGDVFRDRGLLGLLLVYSGFWVMYAQFWIMTPIYATQFGLMALWLAPVFTVVNAGTILLLGPFLERVAKRLPALTMVVSGTGIYVLGLGVLGLIETPYALIVGAVVVSLGELLAQPSFYSYVSSLAPKDRVAVYMSYAFIPIGIGLFGGLWLGSRLYSLLAETWMRPNLYWTVVASVGVLTIAGLILVNGRLQNRRSGSTAAPAPRGGPVRTGAAIVATLLLVPGLLGVGVLSGTDEILTEGGELISAPVVLAAVQGQTVEGDVSRETVELQDALGNLTFRLAWTDEAPSSAATTNAPDAFQLTITTPGGRRLESPVVENPPGTEGVVEVTVPDAPVGTYAIEVRAARCGDETVAALQLPASPAPDTGNAWDLTVTIAP